MEVFIYENKDVEEDAMVDRQAVQLHQDWGYMVKFLCVSDKAGSHFLC